MKIIDVRATPVHVPMTHPLRWSFGVEPGTTRTIVELVTDEGLIGLGESNGGAPLADAVLQCAPLVLGLSPLDVSSVAKRFSIYRVSSEQMARSAQFKLAGAAIEMAMWDLMGKMLGRRCGDLWGGIDREQVEFTAYEFYRWESLEEQGHYSDPQFVAEHTLGMIEQYGFRDVKLKNGVLDPELEIDTVRRIRDTCTPAGLRYLRVDPNQAWSVATSIRVLQKLSEFDVEFCEDPTWGIEGMGLVRQSSPIPLATNMCVIAFDQIPLAVRTHAVDIILGDIHFWGGPTALQQLAKICDAFNLGMSMHSDRELGISTAAILHFASAQPMVSHAIDSHLADQAGDVITEPFTFANGCLQVPDGPGLGVELDREQLKRYHALYLEHGERDEFQDESRGSWRPYLPLW